MASCSFRFTSSLFAQGKPKLTLDEFFNSVSYNSVAISPDGNSVVIATERADWDQKIFRHDLWLYRDQLNQNDAKGASSSAPTLIQLTQSGHDSEPKWSPDGRWIAFLSERKTSSEKTLTPTMTTKTATKSQPALRDLSRRRRSNPPDPR